MAGFRRLYGANPLHLFGHVGLFFIAGWSVDQILGTNHIINWIAWFLGAALLHDLVLLPLYTVLDRVVGQAGRPRNVHARAARRLALVNHVRVPLTVAGILLLVYFPLILGYSSHNYRADTGHALAGYTRNWLLITAGLCVASALVYAGRVVRVRARP